MPGEKATAPKQHLNCNPEFPLELTYKDDSRQCCYELDKEEKTWSYLDGDNEPLMSEAILQLFHGEAGDKALDWCLAHA